jgi:hypothetical protein
MNKPNFGSGAGHPRVEIETHIHTRETLGPVQVVPAGQNLHPYPHPSGQVPSGFGFAG